MNLQENADTDDGARSIPNDPTERTAIAEELGLPPADLELAVRMSRMDPDLAESNPTPLPMTSDSDDDKVLALEDAPYPRERHEEHLCHTKRFMNEEQEIQQAIAASLYDMGGDGPPPPPPGVPIVNATTEFLEQQVYDPALQSGLRYPSDISAILGLPDGTISFPVPYDDVDENNLKALTETIYWGDDSDPGVLPFSLKQYYTELSTPMRDVYRHAVEAGGFRARPAIYRDHLYGVAFGEEGASSPLRTTNVLRWLRHPILFNPQITSPYTLLQLTGGPCGLLGVLQALLLSRLHYGYDYDPPLGPNLKSNIARQYYPDTDVVQRALSEAIAMMLVQAADGQPIKLCWLEPFIDQAALPSLSEQSVGEAQAPSAGLSPSQAPWTPIVESLTLFELEFASFHDCARSLYHLHPVLFCAPRVSGALNILLSLIATRTANRIMEDDFENEKDRTLIGMFGHCNQEMVNLMLVGRATSNLFNGDTALVDEAAAARGSENVEVCVLKGVPRPTLVGYLAEMESMRYCEVGSFLKEPLFPIWVLCCGDHFTVAWSLDSSLVKVSVRDWFTRVAEETFDSLSCDDSGILTISHLPILLEKIGFPTDTLAFGEMRSTLQRLPMGRNGVVLRSDFIPSVENYAGGSQLLKKLSAADRIKIIRGDFKRPKLNYLWHYDGQVRVSDADGTLRILGEGPGLSLLGVRKLPRGSEQSKDRLASVISTRWRRPIEITRYQALIGCLISMWERLYS